MTQAAKIGSSSMKTCDLRNNKEEDFPNEFLSQDLWESSHLFSPSEVLLQVL